MDFSVGDLVEHDTHGTGTVSRTDDRHVWVRYGDDEREYAKGTEHLRPIVDWLANYSSALAARFASNLKAFPYSAVLFSGNGPYWAEELAGLSPPLIPRAVDAIPDRWDLGGLAVVGHAGFSQSLVAGCLKVQYKAPAFLPQEGFIDLFSSRATGGKTTRRF